jgi:hypothetical protein
MSQKQCGHGYWKGVYDALNDTIKTDIGKQAEWCVCQMCIINEEKNYSKLVFPVKELQICCALAGLDRLYVKRIYDYIMHNEPYGCYVSGENGSKWTDDCFILPNGIDGTWQAEAERIAKEAHDEQPIS